MVMLSMNIDKTLAYFIQQRQSLRQLFRESAAWQRWLWPGVCSVGLGMLAVAAIKLALPTAEEP